MHLLISRYLPFLFLLAATVPASTAAELRLSTLDLHWASQGWGAPGIDRSVGGKHLRIAGSAYEHGFGTHAPSKLHLELAGSCTSFTAAVGIDDEDGETGHNGSVEFVITGDDRVLWRSGVMRGGEPAKPVLVPLSGIQHLILSVTNAGDGDGGDHADWASATFEVPETAAAKPRVVSGPLHPRWTLGAGNSLRWDVAAEHDLPHDDFIEQGGLLAGQIASYAISAERTLTLKHSTVWPSLRIIPNNTHGSLIHHYGTEAEPTITVAGMALSALVVDDVVLDGTLTISGHANGLAVTRCTFPTTSQRAVIERWTLHNPGSAAVAVAVAPLRLRDEQAGPYGVNIMEVSHDAPALTSLKPGGTMTFGIIFAARLSSDAGAPILDCAGEEAKRRAYVAGLLRSLRLETPEPVLDRMFAMAKVRVAEAINQTRGGLMLAPGGLSFYAATWCNDNVEYAGPFFPFLGDASGNQASLDTYRGYAAYMKPDYHPIPSSIVAEGTDTWHGVGDRGDAAMYAYGCGRFCLAAGNRAISEELWPAIAWCLEYCRRQTRPDGAIASDSDELEGRFPTGKANLSTISLYYGGLRSAADLARALGRTTDATSYDHQAEAVAKAIESYFGATIDGFKTYRYYDGNDLLRSWICLPLCMGLMARRDDTVAALFSPRLWTDDGLATEAGRFTFWDRSTLYGLRGVFQAGATAKALPYLSSFSQRRLLGEHVPYALETGVKGAQLSSESALYCRVFTEGLFGILPTGLDRFRCTPRLPEGWQKMALRSIRSFAREWELVVERQGARVRITVQVAGKPTMARTIESGETIEMILP